MARREEEYGRARLAPNAPARGHVSVEGLRKSYGDVVALDGVSLGVEPGEFLTLLGPSGCGKTTLLRLLAGFEEPDAGVILISGRDVARLPPYRRPVNTVFQHYALFPHLTVAGNVAFGLESQGRPRTEIAERVARALDLVRLSGLGARGIGQLSGGQKQRVALARALVLEPEVLLLDEPMGALDLKLRQQMQVEVRGLHERVGTTFVFVTHDQDEALMMSDRIAVMNRGRIEQVGRPDDLYERPRTPFVADFLAMKNVLEATVTQVAGGRVAVRTRGGLELTAIDDDGWPAGGRVVVGIRAERVRLDGGADGVSGTIEEESYRGDRMEWRIRVGEEMVTAAEAAAPARRRRRGETVRVCFPAEAVLRLEETRREGR